MIQWWSKKILGCYSCMPLIHQCFPAHQNELEQSSNFQVHQHKHQHKANVTQPVISFYFSFLKKILFYDLLMFFPNSPIYFSPNSNRPLNCLILIALMSLLCLFFLPCRRNQLQYPWARVQNNFCPHSLCPVQPRVQKPWPRGEAICLIWSMKASRESNRIISTARCKDTDKIITKWKEIIINWYLGSATRTFYFI